MRPIDADALYRKVKTECNPYGKPTIGFDDGKKVLKMIDNQPTIEAEPRTNADRFRQMTDEELAKFFNKIIIFCLENKCRINDEVCPLYDCCSCNLDFHEKWLKQEACESDEQ